MKPICFIGARGGSKGVLRKNVRPLANKPLIAHTIESAIESGILHHRIVILSRNSYPLKLIETGDSNPGYISEELRNETVLMFACRRGWEDVALKIISTKQSNPTIEPATAPATGNGKSQCQKFTESQCQIRCWKHPRHMKVECC